MTRKRNPQVQAAGNDESGIPTQSTVDEIEGAAATPDAVGEAKKQWTARPDPFPIHSINWPDGYKVSLIESDGKWDDDPAKRRPKLIYIQFGSGARADQPKNFEAIKEMFSETFRDAKSRMHWDPRVLGWAKELKFGGSPLVREQNRNDRTAVEEAFYKAVEMEEAARGKSLSDHVRQRGGVGM